MEALPLELMASFILVMILLLDTVVIYIHGTKLISHHEMGCDIFVMCVLIFIGVCTAGALVLVEVYGVVLNPSDIILITTPVL